MGNIPSFLEELSYRFSDEDDLDCDQREKRRSIYVLVHSIRGPNAEHVVFENEFEALTMFRTWIQYTDPSKVADKAIQDFLVPRDCPLEGIKRFSRVVNKNKEIIDLEEHFIS